MSTIDMNKNSFDEMVNSGSPVLVEFWAPWCSYCRRIGPAYERVAEEYSGRLTVGRVNIDDEGALADAEKVEVVPTIVLYRDGKAAGSIVAPDSKAAIDEFLGSALSN